MMARLILYALLILELASARAQDRAQYAHDTRTEQVPSKGWDFWIAVPENHMPQKSQFEYDVLYIASPTSTTVHIASLPGDEQTFQLEPFKSLRFKVPVGSLLTSSGIVESKAIHVWSVDADLSV